MRASGCSAYVAKESSFLCPISVYAEILFNRSLLFGAVWHVTSDYNVRRSIGQSCLLFFWSQLQFLSTFGTSATTAFAGTSSTTTAPAATTALSDTNALDNHGICANKDVVLSNNWRSGAGSTTPARTVPQCGSSYQRLHDRRTAPISIMVPSPIAPMLITAPIAMTALLLDLNALTNQRAWFNTCVYVIMLNRGTPEFRRSFSISKILQATVLLQQTLLSSDQSGATFECRRTRESP